METDALKRLELSPDPCGRFREPRLAAHSGSNWRSVSPGFLDEEAARSVVAIAIAIAIAIEVEVTVAVRTLA